VSTKKKSKTLNLVFEDTNRKKELIQGNNTLYSKNIMATEKGTFSYKPTTSGIYTWSFRMKNSGTVAQPASVYYLDNLQVSYPYPYTRIDCDKGPNASYRFGFNGKEKESDMYGESNAYDFGARIHDARIGRWLSVDPLQHKYVSLTPYHFVANSPIAFKDPDGKVIQVAGKYQEQFKEVLTAAFGDKASDFSFNANGNLMFNGTVGNYTEDEQSVLNCLISLMKKPELYRVIYEKQYEKPSQNRKGELVNNTDQTGGEGTIYFYKKDADGKNIYLGADIYVDPANEAGFAEVVRINYYYKDRRTNEETNNKYDAPKDENGQPIPYKQDKEYKLVQLSKYSRTFHGLGHADARSDPKNAMIMENTAGKIHKSTTISNEKTSYESTPIPPRECDEDHCNH